MNQIARRSLLDFSFFDVSGDGLLGEIIFRSEVSNFKIKQAPLTDGGGGSEFCLLILYP